MFVDMSAIYLHIPFCRKICGYCDFFRSLDHRKMPHVVAAMIAELCEERDFLCDKKIKTIYFGGGTPSLLSSEQVGDFLLRIGELYDTSQVEEITLEANPDDLNLEYLTALRGVGVNRLSIGIQSFDDEELKFMNRRHSASQAREAVRAARGVGFDNIAIDLIFGVDGFGRDILERSIDSAIELDVEHIAAYHLTIEPSTIFGRKLQRGELSQVDEEVSDSEYALLHEKLTRAGYEHYEISNYAKEAKRSKHNSSYWSGVEYLGIGPGAHSFNGASRRWAVDSIDSYLQGGEGRYECEVLSHLDRHNEMVMTSLRCAEGLDLGRFEELFGHDQRVAIEKRSRSWIDHKKLKIENGKLYIPPSNYMISDMIIESLFDDKL